LGNPQEVIFSADSIRERYRAKIDQLDQLGDRNKKLNALDRAFAQACENIDGAMVTVATQHGDLYFTNVLLSVDNRVAFLDFDPRKQLREPVYFDLSTFIAEFIVQKVKVKSLGFLLPPMYISEGVELFLRGYFESGEIDRRFLNVYEGIGMVNALYWYQERVKSNKGISRRIANRFYPLIRDYLYRRAYELFVTNV
jgi:thiamine kinase-like enzyme